MTMSRSINTMRQMDSPLHFCSACGCRNLVSAEARYCSRHAALAAQPERPSGNRRNPHGSSWEAARLRIARRDGFACQRCGTAIARFDRDGKLHITGHLHHLTARGAGGSDADANLQMLCATCHAREALNEARHGLRAAWRRDVPPGVIVPPSVRPRKP